MKYTKSDMVKAIIESSGCTETMALKVATRLMADMESTLLQEGKVLISGVGTIQGKIVKEREGVKFGEYRTFEKKIKLTLKTSRALQQKVRNSKTPDFKKLGELLTKTNKNESQLSSNKNH